MSKLQAIPVFKDAKSAVKTCLDKSFVDSLIGRYESNAKSAVEKTILMCQAVSELHKNEKSGRINKHDVDYFCKSVKLRKNSSQYRKYICIGDSAEMFQKYLDLMPQAVSVLYEITTIDSEKFIELIDNQLIDQSTSLRKLKILANKPIVKKVTPKNEDCFKIEFDINTISKESAKMLVDLYTMLKSNSEVTIESSKFDTLQKFLDDSNSFDEEATITNSEVKESIYA